MKEEACAKQSAILQVIGDCSITRYLRLCIITRLR